MEILSGSIPKTALNTAFIDHPLLPKTPTARSMNLRLWIRYATALFVAFLLTASLPVHASMRFTLVMVTPEQFAEIKNNEEALSKILFDSKPDAVLQMDKAWHGVHYLLTGEAYEAEGTLGQVILGGTEFGPDIGYGPAHYLTPQKVIEISAALGNVSIEKFKSRYDPKAMMKAQIYPTVWDREGDEGLNWLVDGLQQVIKFYNRAASQKKGVVLALL